MRRLLSIGLCASAALLWAPAAVPAVTVTGSGLERSKIYVSPQRDPRYTAWVGAWTMPDRSLMVGFTQVTGPVKQGDERDFSGLDMRAVYLRSRDRGDRWTRAFSDPFNAFGPHGHSSQATIGLRDGTLLRRVNGADGIGLTAGPPTAYLQRLAPGAAAWSPPQVLLDPTRFTYQLSRIQRLRDGRLIATGSYAVAPAGTPFTQVPQSRQHWLLMVSADEGLTWRSALSEPPSRVPPNEWDVAELPGGDLLAMMRTWKVDARGEPIRTAQIRSQTLLRRQAADWVMESPQPTPFAHSGHPELLATREGVVLYVATNGVSRTDGGLWYTADRGRTWRPVRFPHGHKYRSAYYPFSLQADDGRIYVFSHTGGDDSYRRGLRQSIIQDSFCLKRKPAAAPCDPRMRVIVTPRRVRAGTVPRFRFRVTAVIGGKRRPVRHALIRFARAVAFTDRSGRASMRRRIVGTGVYRVRVTARRLRDGLSTVRALPPR